MHGHAAVLVLHADAGRGVERLVSLVAEAGAHGGDRLLERDEAFELFALDQQRHVSRSLASATCGYECTSRKNVKEGAMRTSAAFVALAAVLLAVTATAATAPIFDKRNYNYSEWAKG